MILIWSLAQNPFVWIYFLWLLVKTMGLNTYRGRWSLASTARNHKLLAYICLAVMSSAVPLQQWPYQASHVCGLRLLWLQSLCECPFVFLGIIPDAKKSVPFLMHLPHLTLHHIYQITLFWGRGTLTISIFNKEYQALPTAQDLDSGIYCQELDLDRECCYTRRHDCNRWSRRLHSVVCYCDFWLIFSYKQHFWASNMMFENYYLLCSCFTAYSECFPCSPGAR